MVVASCYEADSAKRKMNAEAGIGSRRSTLRPLFQLACSIISDLVHRWIWLILLVVFAILVLSLAHPFSAMDENAAEAEDVASAWDDGISRLGILSLYPPAEDFYVGDLWAVIGSSAAEKSAGLSSGSDKRVTLLGKSVRIAHIDLRNEMQEAKNGQPVFPDTASAGPKVDLLLEADSHVSDKLISLTLAAFPGVTITRKLRANASLGWGLGALGIGRQDQKVEQISIPIAETYGAPVAAAFDRLNDWCSDPKSRFICSESFARRILAFALDEHVLDQTAGKYDFPIFLQFVCRVYMTREIDRRVFVGGDLDADLKVNAGAPAQDLSSSANGKIPDGSVVVDKPATESAGTRMPSGRGNLLVTNSTQIELHETFQHPLVFGYRAITTNFLADSSGKAQP